jgi:soluble lytic murein transglycosylase-like protein
MDRMMHIMSLVGRGPAVSFGAPLGAAATASASKSKANFGAVFSLARGASSLSNPISATSASSLAIHSKLDWSSPANQLPPGTPYAAEFEAAGRKYGISPKLLAAQADVESGFRTDAVSSAGAQGIMQFMPATAQGRGVDPLNPASAIDGAARYMKDLLGRFGSIDVALAAYNQGAATVARAGGVVPAGARRYVDQILNRANGRTS